MEINDFRNVDRPGSPMKASFVVRIPEWDFNIAISYFERADGSSWFGYPQQEWTNKEGEKKYRWLAFFGEKGKPRFEKALRESLKEKISKPSHSAEQERQYSNHDELPF